jgi:hypothetical protein
MSDVSISSSDSENDNSSESPDGLTGTLAKKLGRLKKNQPGGSDGSHAKGGSENFSEHSSSWSNIGRDIGGIVQNLFNKKDEVPIDRIKTKPYKIQPKITFHISRTCYPVQPKIAKNDFLSNKYISVFKDSIMMLGRLSVSSALALQIPGRRASRAVSFGNKMTQENKRQLYNTNGTGKGQDFPFKAQHSMDSRGSMKESEVMSSSQTSSSSSSSSVVDSSDHSVKANIAKTDMPPKPEIFAGNLLEQPTMRARPKAKSSVPVESLNMLALRNRQQPNGSTYAIPQSARGNARQNGQHDSFNLGQRESWTANSAIDSQLGKLGGGTPAYRNNAFFRRTEGYRNQMYPGRKEFQETAAERLNSTSKIAENLKKNPFRIEVMPGGGKNTRPLIPGLRETTPKSRGSKFGISPLYSRVLTGGADSKYSRKQSDLNLDLDSKPSQFSNFFGINEMPSKIIVHRSSTTSNGSRKFRKPVPIRREDSIKINLYNLDDSIKKKKSIASTNETNLLRKIKDSVRRSSLFAPAPNEDCQKTSNHDHEDLIEKFSERNIIHRRDDVKDFNHKRSRTGQPGGTLDVKAPVSRYKKMLDDFDNDQDELFVGNQAKVGIPKVISDINDLDLSNRGIKMSSAYNNYDNYVNLALNK